MNFDFITTAVAASGSQGTETGGILGNSVVLIAFLFIFYFLLWRPQSKRAASHRDLMGSLQKGDEVITTGGLLGVITKVSDDFISLRVADNVEINCQKAAVSSQVPKGTFKSITQ